MAVSDIEILQRLQACESDLEAHRGYLKALEYGLRVAIISHPERDSLARTWRRLLPAIAQKHAPQGGVVYKAALEQALVLLTDQIEAPNPESSADGKE